MQHQFNFNPLHYGAGGARQREFKQRVGEELRSYGFYFSGEVRLSWHLFLDEQDRWESSGGADVDNFAKLLNDAVKGPDGLLFDDSQVQRLEIAWLPAEEGENFELTVHCRIDEFVARPASLYEMGDGLWYPVPDDAMEVPTAKAMLLPGLDHMTVRTKMLRHYLRQGGLLRREAFKEATVVQPTARGFHYSRIAESGFPLVRRREWLAQLGNPATRSADPVQEAQQLAVEILAARRPSPSDD
jgi:Holliday junction resolvase RusA-like endonuclease